MGYLFPCKRAPGIRGNSGVKFLPIQVFLYMQKNQEKARKSQEWLGSGKARKAKRIFSTLSRLFLMCRKAWKGQESQELWSFLGSLGFFGFFWKGPGQLVLLDSIIGNLRTTTTAWSTTTGSELHCTCLLYTSPSPRDGLLSRMPSSA